MRALTHTAIFPALKHCFGIAIVETGDEFAVKKTNSRLSTRIYKLEVKIVTFRSCKKDRTPICAITCHLQVSVIVYYLRRIQDSVNDPRWSFFVTTVNGNPRTQMVIRFSTEIKIESKNCNIPILIKEEI